MANSEAPKPLPSRFHSLTEPFLAPTRVTSPSIQWRPMVMRFGWGTVSNIFPGHFLQVQSDLFPASSLALFSGRNLNYPFKSNFKFQALPPFSLLPPSRLPGIIIWFVDKHTISFYPTCLKALLSRKGFISSLCCVREVTSSQGHGVCCLREQETRLSPTGECHSASREKGHASLKCFTYKSPLARQEVTPSCSSGVTRHWCAALQSLLKVLLH